MNAAAVVVPRTKVIGSSLLEKTQAQGAAYHPQFSSQDADITLCSVDGTLFRVHSYTLRTTSGLFQTIFSLPQPAGSAPSPMDKAQGSFDNTRSTVPTPVPATTIPIYETTFLLSQILPLMTGRNPPQPLHSLSLPTLSRLLFLAEKWDTPGPISQIRCVINGSYSVDGVQLFSTCSPFSPFSPFVTFSSPLLRPPPLVAPTPRSKPGFLNGFFRADPLRVYVLSRHFQWQDEAERAAVGTLAMTVDELEKKWNDLDEGKVEGRDEGDVIMHMVTNRDRELLIDLRRRRCRAFKESIDNGETFTAGNNPNYSCIRCGYGKLDNSSWNALKQVMMAELEARPLGDTLLASLVIPTQDDSYYNNIASTTCCPSATTAAAPLCAASQGGGPATTSTRKPRRLEDELWPELISCFAARCKACGVMNYDPLATLKQIRFCVEALPWKIAWEEDGIQ
ncbi:hypothetical protein AX15_000539 [Amanita polypyramis BW_CC]|nr:hypothetical protein AX15_000539 [Amanita polypyramis BW_CC]